MPRLNLTERAIAAYECPPDKSEVLLWDAVQPGLCVRVWRGGSKTYVLRYRAGHGRYAPIRKYTIGTAGEIALGDARKAAKALLGEIALGNDPHAARVAQRGAAERADASRLVGQLDAYEADLTQRGVVKCGEVLSALRRDLLARVGDVDVRSLDRATIVRAINAVVADGRPGAAAYLRKSLTPFCNFMVNAGTLAANPMAGWRRPRRSRAERLAPAGRALADHELGAVWRAADAAGWPFGPYLHLLLLLGQRRTETAVMRWRDVDLTAGVWTIPAEITKSGRAHRVPLPPEAVAVLAALPRMVSCDLVFPGRGDRPMSGFSKRLRPIYSATAAERVEPWSLHDLRRTMRTGLGRLGVAPHVAELLLNHAVSDELARIYDRGEHWQARGADAAGRWARHVAGVLEQGPKIVPLPARVGR